MLLERVWALERGRCVKLVSKCSDNLGLDEFTFCASKWSTITCKTTTCKVGFTEWRLPPPLDGGRMTSQCNLYPTWPVRLNLIGPSPFFLGGFKASKTFISENVKYILLLFSFLVVGERCWFFYFYFFKFKR